MEKRIKIEKNNDCYVLNIGNVALSALSVDDVEALFVEIKTALDEERQKQLPKERVEWNPRSGRHETVKN